MIFFRKVLIALMSQTVIDFGPVDWGRIWGDRASLVTAAHLKELNEISAQTHLTSPGYWRNLFASYSEIRADAAKIVRLYTRPGQTPKFFATTTTTAIPLPGQVNKISEDKRNAAIQERDQMFLESAEFVKNPFNVAGVVMSQKVKDTDAYKTGEKIVNKATEIGEKVGKTAENLVDLTKNLSTLLNNSANQSQYVGYALLGFGAVLTASYAYSSVKNPPK